MDTRLLRTFQAVVEHGSFTAAAASLGYTQSAVSQQVGALEASLGVELFQRRPFRLTPAAERLAEHAGTILLRLDVAATELRAIDQARPRRLLATPFAAASPEVVALLGGAGAGGELGGASAPAIVEAVGRGSCTAGAVDGIVGVADPLGTSDPGLLTSLPLVIAPLAVLLPADHPFAARPQLAWTAVADAQWLDAPAIAPAMGPGAAQLIVPRLGATRYSGTDTAALASLVAAGHGLALVPSWWSSGTDRVRAVPLTSPALVHRIEVLVLRSTAAEWAPLVARARG